MIEDIFRSRHRSEYVHSPQARIPWHVTRDTCVTAAWQENCSDWPLPGSSEPDSLWWPDTDDEWSTWFISTLQSQSEGFNVTCDHSEDNQRNSFCQKSYNSIFFTSPKASQWKQKTLLKHLNDECNSINSQFWAVWGKECNIYFHYFNSERILM